VEHLRLGGISFPDGNGSSTEGKETFPLGNLRFADSDPSFTPGDVRLGSSSVCWSNDFISRPWPFVEPTNVIAMNAFAA
jgi:hypothetical protein